MSLIFELVLIILLPCIMGLCSKLSTALISIGILSGCYFSVIGVWRKICIVWVFFGVFLYTHQIFGEKVERVPLMYEINLYTKRLFLQHHSSKYPAWKLLLFKSTKTQCIKSKHTSHTLPTTQTIGYFHHWYCIYDRCNNVKQSSSCITQQLSWEKKE